MGKPDDKPNAAAFGKLRSRLAARGLKPADLDAACDTAAKGRTVRQVRERLVEWLRGRPKGDR